MVHPAYYCLREHLFNNLHLLIYVQVEYQMPIEARMLYNGLRDGSHINLINRLRERLVADLKD